MVGEQLAEVLAGCACRRGVEAVVRQGDRAVAEPTQQLVDFRVAFPGVDALGPIHVGEHVDDAGGLGRCWPVCREQEGGEVVAQGAAGAEPSAVVLALGSAAVAVQVGGDAGAGSAELPAPVAAWEQPVPAAAGAGAVGAGGVVEADAADVAVGPADPDLAGASPAAIARAAAGRSRAAAWAASGGCVSHRG